jgi:hypothetical protein
MKPKLVLGPNEQAARIINHWREKGEALHKKELEVRSKYEEHGLKDSYEPGYAIFTLVFEDSDNKKLPEEALQEVQNKIINAANAFAERNTGLKQKYWGPPKEEARLREFKDYGADIQFTVSYDPNAKGSGKAKTALYVLFPGSVKWTEEPAKDSALHMKHIASHILNALIKEDIISPVQAKETGYPHIQGVKVAPRSDSRSKG